MKRRRLGQHYLADGSVADALIARAGIRKSDLVVEIGTGRGVLTGKLAGICGRLVAYEVDEENVEETRLSVGDRPNTELRLGDAFEEKADFDVLVSSLPYSESARFVEWLSTREYRTASVLLQDDFARKISAAPGERNYRAVSAIAQMSADMDIGPRVRRDAFDPQPKVASRLVTLTHLRTLTDAQVRLTKRLFGIRRRTLSAAAKTIGMPETPMGEERVFRLPPEKVYELVSTYA